MMNIVGTNTVDATASQAASAARHKGGEKSEGFSDALSEFDKDPIDHKAADQNIDEEEGGQPQAEDAEQADAGKSRPIIELRPESVRRPVIDIRQGLERLAEQAAAATEGSAGKTATRELTAAEKKLKDALTAAKALADKADATSRAKGASAADETDLDIDTLIAGDDSNLELADVLSLLDSHGAAAAMEGMGPTLKGMNGSTGKRGQADNDVGRGKSEPVARSENAVSGPSLDPLAVSAEVEGSPVEDRTFRFEASKGSRQSMDMIVGEGRGERTAEFRSASAGGTAETVAVLDSRRFLGLSPNASALTSALSGDKEWAAAMQGSSATENVTTQNQTGGVVHTLKLQMTPHALGSVTATLKLHGEELSVHLTVETRAAYRQLSDDSSGIVDALRSQGFAVDQVTLSIAPSAGADDANNQQTGQSGQHASAQGERQGNTGRGQENAASRQSFDQASGNGNEPASENQTSPAAGNARPGQLYL